MIAVYILYGVVFIGGFPPSIARLSEYNYELLKNLSRLIPGVKIYVLANEPDFYTTKYMEKEELERLPSNIEVLYTWKPSLTHSLLYNILKLRKRSNVLIISIYHGIFGNSGIANLLTVLLLYIFALLLRYKVVTILHTLPEARESLYSMHGLNKLYYLGFRIFTSIVVYMSEKILLPVEKYRDIMLGSYTNLNGKLAFIPHGVPIYKLCGEDRKENCLNLAFIGLISPRKNLELLINIMDKLVERGIRCKLYIIGTIHPYYRKESREKLLKIIKEGRGNVEWFGYMKLDKLQEFICKNIDVIILPYHASTGTSGIVHFIAPAAKPVILPFFYEFYELYKQGYGILLIRDNNTDEYVEKIYRLVSDRGVYAEIKKRMIYASLKYSMDKIAHRLLEILKG